MADTIINVDDNLGEWIPIKAKDLGDGTYAIASVSIPSLSSIPSVNVQATYSTSSTTLSTAYGSVNTYLSGSSNKLLYIKYSIAVTGVTPTTVTHYFVVFEIV